MADTYTTNLNLTKPEVGASTDTWGTKLNADLDSLDAIFASNGTSVALNLDGAVIDNSVIGGTTPAAGSFTSLDASGNITVGTSDTIIAENNIRFKSAGASYIDHFTVGQDINFRVSNSSSLDINALTIDSSGNIGFGQTSPVTFGAGTKGLTINGSTSHITWQNSGTNVAFAYNSGNNFIIGSEQAGSSTIFTAAGSQHMRIDSSGNVGIGTSSPSTKLDVVGSGKFQPAVGGGDALVTIAQTNSNAYVHAGVKINAGNANPFYIYQSGSSNTLRFNYNSLSDAGGQMVITDGGNVGIGTASPDTKLHVHKGSAGSVTALSDSSLVIENSTHNYLTFLSPNNVENAIIFGDADSNNVASFGYNHSSNHMGFATNGSERMRIDSAGTIYQGCTSPTLHSAVTGIVFTNGSLITDSTRIDGGAITLSQNLAVDSGNTYAYLANGEGSYYQQFNGNHYFATAASGSAGADASLSTLMTIANNGDLLVNCSSLPSASVKGFGIDAKSTIGMIVTSSSATGGDSHMQMFNPNGQVGSIVTSGSSTAFNTSSDYRLKENVNYDFNALDRVAQLKPARFNFIADADTTVDGFLAHEVQDIVPEAITGEKDGVDSEGNPEYQGIDQSKLVPLLVKAIQEQQEQIDDLKSRIETLEG